jgi:hypothetical protein
MLPMLIHRLNCKLNLLIIIEKGQTEIMKKILYSIVLVACLIQILFSFNPIIKTDILHALYKGTHYIYYTFHKLVLNRQNPICYTNDDIIANKLKNPSPWVLEQINRDFSHYTKFSTQAVEETFNIFGNKNMIVKIEAKDGKVIITKKDSTVLNGAFEFGLSIYKTILIYALQKGYIKNVTFLFTDMLTNIPSGYFIRNLAPIVVVAKDISREIDKDLVLIPDWMNLNSWHKLKPRIDAAINSFPWDKKISKMIWRGGVADVTGYRKKLVAYSELTHSKFIDAKFVQDGDKDFMHPEHHLLYKFQISVDGHTAPWERPVWQLYSNSLMIKQKSPFIQWYYNAIKPEQHYVEYSGDPEELMHITEKYTDEQMQQLSSNARDFVKNNLSADDMVAYIILVLQRLEKLQNHF